MRTIELFCGTKSFSKVMKKHGHATFTIDNDHQFKPDISTDILTWHVVGSRKVIYDILWASPPCTAFSVASIGANWTGGKNAYIPKTDKARTGIKLVDRTRYLIDELNPDWWFIENPRGVLRKVFNDIWLFRRRGIRHTITYCQYGDTRMKPTDIWTNAYWWKPRPMCKNGDKCHQAAPRGAKTGTQGIKGARDRGVIPPTLFEEILEQMPV